MHEAAVLEYVAKVLPDFDQSWVLAIPVLLATPPIVLAAPQEGQPPEIQAGRNFLLC
jgi:hypothetical protein